jgi:hypothetical protein
MQIEVEITLRKRDSAIHSLQQAISDGNIGLNNVPGLLRRIIKEEAWRERLVHQTGELVRFEKFTDFLNALPPEGLHADLHKIKLLCSNDPDVLDLLDQVTVGKVGAPAGNRNAARGGTIRDMSTVTKSRGRVSPTGNSTQRVLRVLRTANPELYEAVRGKQKTAAAAMREAGLRKRVVQVYPDDLELSAKVIRREFVGQVERLIEVLRRTGE